MRSLIELLTHLRSQGVSLSLDGGALKCNAPKGVLTSELRNELAQRKPELIAFLKNSHEAARSGGSAIMRVAREASMPLSFAQQRLWFLHQLDPQNPAYNVAAALRLKGKLYVAEMEQALFSIIQRHEALRTSFIQKNGAPVTIIHDSVQWRLASIDLTTTAEDEQEQALHTAISGIARTPFDLSQGPLIRGTLIALAPEEYALVLTMHHIVSDGWSIGVFVREFGECYLANIAGKNTVFLELPVQYSDFAVWQKRWLEGGELDRQLPYWKGQLADVPPLVHFPPDHRRPQIEQHNGHRLLLTIPREIVSSLEELSRREGATLFMVLLAAFKVLLYRYSGQSDIVIGSPSANRNRTELQGLIGFFVNNLVLRTNLEGNPTFQEIVARVREVTLQAYDHQDVPFDQLVQALRPERTIDHSPLFQTMFTLQNFPLEDLELSGLTVQTIELDLGTARFDLSVEVFPRHGELRAYFEYNAHLYEQHTIEHLQRHFVNILHSVIADITQHIDAIPLLLPEERELLLDTWNETSIPREYTLCFHQRFELQAQTMPERVALIAGDISWTYQELNASANKIAHALCAQGVKTGDLVAIFIERSPQMMTALLGIMKSGGVYIPLDPIYPKQRVAGILEDAQPKIILTSSKLESLLPETSTTLLSVDALLEAGSSEELPILFATVTQQDLAYVIFTSGSTGRPKGVEISHGALMNFLESMQREPGFTIDDVMLAVTTISFDIAGLELYLPLLAGGRVCIAVEPGNPETLLADLERVRPTVMQATPATWQLLLSSDWQGNRNLKILCGGEALETNLAASLLQRADSLWNMYGPTETTIWSAALRVDSTHAESIPIGRPIANTSFYVVDAYCEPVPIGVAGELLIGGEGLARGYLHRSELTQEKFIPDPFSTTSGARLYRTGDLVRYRHDGTLEFLGRLDHQVKLRGFRIELGEIENVIRQQPGVKDAVVLLREIGGDKQLVAWLTSKTLSTQDVHAIRSVLRQSLPEYMVPAHIIPLQEFPRTPNGKLDRSSLASPENKVLRKQQPSNETFTPLQESIASVFRELLHLEKINLHENFFDIGAHSLLLVRAHDRLKRDIDSQLTLVNFFQFPTIASLAEFVRKRINKSTHSSLAMQVEA